MAVVFMAMGPSRLPGSYCLQFGGHAFDSVPTWQFFFNYVHFIFFFVFVFVCLVFFFMMLYWGVFLLHFGYFF